MGLSHLVQLVQVGGHQTDQLTGADLIQDPTGQLQGLESSKVRRSVKVKVNRMRGSQRHQAASGLWERLVMHAKQAGST